MVSVEYNPKDPNILAGGCYNGQVSQPILCSLGTSPRSFLPAPVIKIYFMDH